MTDVSKIDDALAPLQGLHMQEIEDIRVKLTKLRGELEDASKKAFAEISKVLFERFPDLKSFGWRQYTPYFNDGDTCEFSVNDYDIDINGVNLDYGLGEDDDDVVNWESETIHDGYVEVEKNYYGTGKTYKTYDYNQKINERPNPDYNPNLAEAKKSAQKLLGALDEDALKAMFGDHVHVTVYADHVDVDHYDHE